MSQSFYLVTLKESFTSRFGSCCWLVLFRHSRGCLWLELGSTWSRGPRFGPAGQEISEGTKWGMTVFVVMWKVRECESKLILNRCFRDVVYVAFCIAREYCPEKPLHCPQLNPLLWHKMANVCLNQINICKLPLSPAPWRAGAAMSQLQLSRAMFSPQVPLKKISGATFIHLCLKILQIWFPCE